MRNLILLVFVSLSNLLIGQAFDYIKLEEKVKDECLNVFSFDTDVVFVFDRDSYLVLDSVNDRTGYKKFFTKIDTLIQVSNFELYVLSEKKFIQVEVIDEFKDFYSFSTSQMNLSTHFPCPLDKISIIFIGMNHNAYLSYELERKWSGNQEKVYFFDVIYVMCKNNQLVTKNLGLKIEN